VHGISRGSEKKGKWAVGLLAHTQLKKKDLVYWMSFVSDAGQNTWGKPIIGERGLQGGARGNPGD